MRFNEAYYGLLKHTGTPIEDFGQMSCAKPQLSKKKKKPEPLELIWTYLQAQHVSGQNQSLTFYSISATWGITSPFLCIDLQCPTFPSSYWLTLTL